MINTKFSSYQEMRTILSGVRWQTYQALSLDLAEDSGKRLTYDRGILEIMTPLPQHEASKRLLGRMVESATEELGLEIYSLGSTTWNREDLQRGLEPDECYYITNEKLMRGKVKIDLSMDPPPDLAIEIDITSSSLNRLEIYAALGIAEVWRFDGEDLSIYVLGNSEYELRENSQVLPILKSSDLLSFITRKGDLGENALIREFRNWLKQFISVDYES